MSMSIALMIASTSLGAVETGVAPASISASSGRPSPLTDGPHRQYGDWRSSRIGGGGYLMGAAIADAVAQRNTYYTWMDVGGLYRSDDRGLTWRMLHGAWPVRPFGYCVRDALFDPRNPDWLLVGVGSMWGTCGLLRSTDGGTTWAEVQAGSFQGNGEGRWAGRVLARHPTRADLLLAGSVGTGVFRSEDNGATWSRIAGLDDLFCVDVGFAGDVAWVASVDHSQSYEAKRREGLFRSTDAGHSFAPVALADAALPTEIQVVAGDTGPWISLANRGRELLISRDQGLSWSPWSQGLPIKPDAQWGDAAYNYQGLALGSSFALVTSTDHGLWRRPFDAATWTRLAEPTITGIAGWYGGDTAKRYGWQVWSSHPSAVVIDRQDERHWLLTDWFALYQTWDAGATWGFTSDGIEGFCVHDLRADPTDPSVVHLAAADLGAFTSRDGGASFIHPERDPGPAFNAMRISVHRDRPQQLRAVGGFGWTSNRLFVSDDGGVHWSEPAATGLPDRSLAIYSGMTSDPSDPARFYLVVHGPMREGGGGIYVTSDDGRSWTRQSAGLPEDVDTFHNVVNHVGQQLAVDIAGDQLAISHRRGEAWFRTRDAATWTPVILPDAGTLYTVISEAASGGFLLGTDHGLFRTGDRGTTWTRLTSHRVQHVTIDVQHPQHLAIATPTAVWYSADSGATWNDLTGALPFKTAGALALAGERLVIGTVGSGVFWRMLPIP